MVTPSVLLVGDVPPQSEAVWRALCGRADIDPWSTTDAPSLRAYAETIHADLIVVAGWRHLIPPDVLAIPRLGTVGFHSAKLPEYPGRAPVPWTLLRGDEFAYNTMLYLDEGVDTGDIIDTRRQRIYPSDTPASLYEWMARSSVEMLTEHLPALLAGTAPRHPQAPARRGPLTTVDGWKLWEARCAS